VIVHCFPQACVPGADPLYVFLPLALVGFATAVILGVQWSAVVISGRDQDSLKHHSVSKGADQ
jgi:hypothetical protein